MKILMQEALRYTAVSAGAFLIDISLLFMLVNYLSWWYLAAATASFLVGLIFGYAFSVTLVFEYRRLKDKRMEFATFAAIGAVGIAINAAVMFVGVKCLGLHYLIAKCGAAALTFLFNFTARRHLLFVRRGGLTN
jgi:putative flippase GtrA